MYIQYSEKNIVKYTKFTYILNQNHNSFEKRENAILQLWL